MSHWGWFIVYLGMSLYCICHIGDCSTPHLLDQTLVNHLTPTLERITPLPKSLHHHDVAMYGHQLSAGYDLQPIIKKKKKNSSTDHD